MVEPREPYRTHHMLLPVIGSLGASLLTLCLNGNVKNHRQPDASCTLTYVQTNKQNAHTEISAAYTLYPFAQTFGCSTPLHALSMAWYIIILHCQSM